MRDASHGAAAGIAAIVIGRAELLTATLVAAFAGMLCPASASAQTKPAGAARVVVLPFENAGREPRVFWLGEGSSVVLTDDLVALGIPAFSRDERLRVFRRLDVPVVASLSHATAIRIGQALGAAQVIVGDFDLSVGQLTVRARAIRLDTGRISPEIVERGPLTDIFGVYARVARRLAPDSRVTLEEMEQSHPPLPAFEVYVKGLLAEAPATRLSFLSQAMGMAPTFQRARIALWHAYADQNDHQRALAIARQVPGDHRFGRQAQFLAAISLLELSRYQEAFDALNALQRAAPDAAVLNNLGVVQLRRPGAAPAAPPAAGFFEQARQLDPLDTDIVFNIGYAYSLSRDVISATYWLREAVRLRPSDAAAHYVLGVALQSAGSAAEAAREKDAARRLSNEFVEWDAKQPGANAAPKALERLKTDLSTVP